MKKMKKFLAMMLAMAMVMGLSLTAFAVPNSAKITVSNIAKPNQEDTIGDATVSYVQVIKQAPMGNGNTTGWDFVSENYALSYIQAYTPNTEYSVENAQAAIQALINDKGQDGYTKSASEAKAAIDGLNVSADAWTIGESDVASGNAEWTVTQPGLYIVKIDQVGYSYKPMAAYVAFSQVTVDTDGNYSYPAMSDAELVAKGAGDEERTTKTSNDADKVAAIGDEIEYTIETIVPFVQMDNLRSWGDYVVKDTLVGADFKVDTIEIKYKDNNDFITLGETDVSLNEETNTLTINLTSQLGSVAAENANANANRTIVITYTATVNSVDPVTNTAQTGHQKGETFEAKYGKGEETIFTGSVKINKTGENGAPLAGAGFEVTKDTETTPLHFTPVYVKNAEGADTEIVDYYQYAPEGTITTIMTKADGTATIKGLDIGTYSFKETVAPDGYSINAQAENGTIALVAGKTEATAQIDIVSTDANMTDTRLSSLPSTGGIGTTIFTIGGCAIMIIAAGLYFSLRRKSAK